MRVLVGFSIVGLILCFLSRPSLASQNLRELGFSVDDEHGATQAIAAVLDGRRYAVLNFY